MTIEDGQIYYINFKGSIGTEINSIHLGIIYRLPILPDLLLCIPLTSPKLKHFKTESDFNKRNYLEMKHFSWQYLKQTDSIALIDQIKTISVNRLLAPFENQDKEIIKLDEHTQKILKMKIIKYINIVLYKN